MRSFKPVQGLDAKGISNLMEPIKGEKWEGIGVDPNSGSGSFEAILQAVRDQIEVPVNLCGHVVLLKEITPINLANQLVQTALEMKRKVEKVSSGGI
jgi:hypothetical protein